MKDSFHFNLRPLALFPARHLLFFSNTSTPQYISLSSPIITLGRYQQSFTHCHINSNKYPTAISRLQATIKHICGRVFESNITGGNPNLVPTPALCRPNLTPSSVPTAVISRICPLSESPDSITLCTPRCPFHYCTLSQCGMSDSRPDDSELNRSPTRRQVSNPHTPSYCSSSYISPAYKTSSTPAHQTSSTPNQSLNLPFVSCCSYHPPDPKCQTSCCGGGWVLIDGSPDGSRHPPNSLSINSVPIRQSKSVVQSDDNDAYPIGVWLRNADRIILGPSVQVIN